MRSKMYIVITAMIANLAFAAYLAQAQSFPSEITLQQSNENRYFPLHMGKYWKWDISVPKQGIRNAVSEEAVVKDLGNVFINGTRNFRKGKIVSAVATVYRMQSGSVFMTEQKTDNIGGTPLHITYKEPCLVMPDRPVADMVWSCETERKNAETGADETVSDNFLVESIGDVKTNSGHYNECVKIRQDRTIAGDGNESKVLFNKWYCKKIGLTKIERDGVTVLQLVESKDVEVEIQEEAPTETTPDAAAPAETTPAAEESKTLSLEEQAAIAESQNVQPEAKPLTESTPASEETTASEKEEPRTGDKNTYDIVNLPPYPDPAVPSIGIIGWSADQKRVAYLEVLKRGNNKPVRTALKIVEVANNDVVWNYSRRMCGNNIKGCSAGDIVIKSDDVDYARVILLENRDALRNFNIGSDSGYVYVIPEGDAAGSEDKDKQSYFALVLSPSKQSVFTLLPGGGKVSGDELERGWQYVAGGSGAWEKETVTDVAQAPVAVEKQPEASATPTAAVSAAPEETAPTETPETAPAAEPELNKLVKQSTPAPEPTPTRESEPQASRSETVQPTPGKPQAASVAVTKPPEKTVAEEKTQVTKPEQKETVNKKKEQSEEQPVSAKIVVAGSESMAATTVGEEEKVLPVPPSDVSSGSEPAEDIKQEKENIATEPAHKPKNKPVSSSVPEPGKKNVPSWQLNTVSGDETASADTASWVSRIKTNSDSVPENTHISAAVPASDEVGPATSGRAPVVAEKGQPATKDVTLEKTEKKPPPPEAAAVEKESEAAGQKPETVPAKAAKAVAKKKPKEIKCPSGMALIPAGEFMMGCSAGDKNCENSERPPHRVKISKQFCMDKYEVTQAKFQETAGRNPSSKKECGSDCPVESVTWKEAAAYCEKIGGILPTEAQWEYAARAGSVTSFYWGNEPDKYGTRAWSWNNSMKSPHRVGLKVPNEFGLYDTAGNVWEWTGDCYAEYDKSGAVRVDPSYDKKNCDNRVIRGGSWVNGDYNYFRVSKRNREKQDEGTKYIGFRCIAAPETE